MHRDFNSLIYDHRRVLLRRNSVPARIYLALKIDEINSFPRISSWNRLRPRITTSARSCTYISQSDKSADCEKDGIIHSKL